MYSYITLGYPEDLNCWEARDLLAIKLICVTYFLPVHHCPFVCVCVLSVYTLRSVLLLCNHLNAPITFLCKYYVFKRNISNLKFCIIYHILFSEINGLHYHFICFLSRKKTLLVVQK